MRDPERQFKFESSFTVSFPDFPSFDMPAKAVVVQQEVGKHDIAIITFSRLSSFLIKAANTGVPVVVTWKNGVAKGSFHGYVSHLTTPVAHQVDTSIKITCIGASYPLKEHGSKIWVNKTADQIVTDIAKKFRLTPKVTPSPIRWGQQSLAGHSYWEKIAELAHNVGYTFQVIGTELHFHPLDVMLDRNMSSIPVLSFSDMSTPREGSAPSPTLDRFDVLIGDYFDGEKNTRTTKHVNGVDPVTAKRYTASNSPNKVGKSLRKNPKSPLFNSVETRDVVGSPKMAKSIAEARAQLSRLTLPATGSGQGDPRIAPYRTIEVRNVGERTDGFYVVSKVTHTLLGSGRYGVEFSCKRDADGANKPSASRPSTAKAVPTRETSDTASAGRKEPRLSAPVAMTTQSSGGFTTTPRRWVSN